MTTLYPISTLSNMLNSLPISAPLLVTCLQIFMATLPSTFLLCLCGIFLFFRPKFILHRVGGFIFLLQYIAVWTYYFLDYRHYIQSPFILTLPINGCLQTLTAMYYFRFLPKMKVDPGYYGDQGAITYAFVQENMFFQLITLFGAMYNSDMFYPYITSTVIGQIFEATWVFLPFVLFRPLFPTTHFRDALQNDKGKSEQNKIFYFYGTYVIKLFYIFGKHFMGYFVMYVRFLNNLSEAQKENIQFMMIANAGTVSIGIFLHTLRFKKLLDPRIAYSIYVILAYTPTICLCLMADIFLQNLWVVGLTLLGALSNFAPRRVWSFYQVCMMILFFSIRHSSQISDFVFQRLIV